jgi:hypothetical protein
MLMSIEILISLTWVFGFLNYELLKPLREFRYEKNKDKYEV